MRRQILKGLSAIGLLALLLCGSPGCVRLAANLVNAIQGSDRPAEYNGFEKQRVAIVCGTDKGLSTDATSALLTGYVHMALNTNVKKIELVRQDEVEQWLDAHGWTESDYVEIGKAVKADKLLAIDVSNMTVKDGATLFRGQCDIAVTVYDIADNGSIVYRKQIPEFTFPKMGGPTIADTTEPKFKNLFVTIIAKKVAGLFYPVDPTSDYAIDATANSF
jgi:hypothetical protein